MDAKYPKKCQLNVNNIQKISTLNDESRNYIDTFHYFKWKKNGNWYYLVAQAAIMV